jgi:hypothetical protein
MENNTQKVVHSHSVAPKSTIKPKRNESVYSHRSNSSDHYSNANFVERQADVHKIDKIDNHNYSGTAVYKVPNINFHTALRSSKRQGRYG